MTTALEGGEGLASRPGRSLPPGKDPVPIVQEAGWAPGPVWTGAENLTTPPGFDPRWDSNPESHQAKGHTPTPYTARTLEPASA